MDLKEEFLSGPKKFIYSVILDNGTSPAVEFLRALKARDPKSHKSMVLRYQRHAANGPSGNPKQELHITSKGNLWEFKTRQGDRLVYFNLSGNRIALTIGFHKGEPAQKKYDQAAKMRDAIIAKEKADDADRG